MTLYYENINPTPFQFYWPVGLKKVCFRFGTKAEAVWNRTQRRNDDDIEDSEGKLVQGLPRVIKDEP